MVPGLPLLPFRAVLSDSFKEGVACPEALAKGSLV